MAQMDRSTVISSVVTEGRRSHHSEHGFDVWELHEADGAAGYTCDRWIETGGVCRTRHGGPGVLLRLRAGQPGPQAWTLQGNGRRRADQRAGAGNSDRMCGAL